MAAHYFWRTMSGSEYLFRMFPYLNRWQVTMHHPEKSLTWQGNFDQTLVDKMTFKAGRHVPIETFFSLLSQSFQQGDVSENRLSVLTARNLEELIRENKSLDRIGDIEDEENRKMYLILTVSLPAQIHYPLVLKLIDIPDPQIVVKVREKHQYCQAISAHNPKPALILTDLTNSSERKNSRFENKLADMSKVNHSQSSDDKDFQKLRGSILKGLEKDFRETLTGPVVSTSREFIRRELALKQEVAKLREQNERLKLQIDEMKVKELDMSTELLANKRKLLSSSLGSRFTTSNTTSAKAPNVFNRRTKRIPPNNFNYSRLSPSERCYYRSYAAMIGSSSDNLPFTTRSDRNGSWTRHQVPARSRSLDAIPERRLLRKRRSSLENRYSPVLSRFGGKPGTISAPLILGSNNRFTQRLASRSPSLSRRSGSSWLQFDPTRYVLEKRDHLRRRSEERQRILHERLLNNTCSSRQMVGTVRRTRGRELCRRVGMLRSGSGTSANGDGTARSSRNRDISSGNRRSFPKRDPTPTSAESMRQLENRLKNIQKLLTRNG